VQVSRASRTRQTNSQLCLTTCLEYGWAVYNFSDWDLICTAPGHLTAEAAGYAATMWLKGRDTGYEQGEESGADSVRRGMLKLLGFDKATVKVLDDYGVARPTNI